MLIKRKNFMTSSAGFVKKLTGSSLAAIALCSALPASPAFAGELWVDKTVMVKFKLSELQTDRGVNKVYAKLKKKAASFCRADQASLHFIGQSTKACTADLMNQFIENADIDSLKTIHLAKQSAVPVKKYALN